MAGPNEPTNEPPNEPPNEPTNDPTAPRPEWETTEFAAFPGFETDPSSDGFDQPSYGYGTPPSSAQAGQQGYPGQNYPSQQNYPSGQVYPSQQGYPGNPNPSGNRRRTALIATTAAVVTAGAATGIYFAVSGSGDKTPVADTSSSLTRSPTSAATDPMPSSSTPSSTTPSTSTPTSPTSTSGGTVVAPTSFGEYMLLDNPAANAAKAGLADQAKGTGPAADLFKAATVAVYGRSGSDAPSLITFSLPTSKVPGTPAAELFTSSFLGGAGVTPKTVDTGTHGGSAKCGATASGSESLCAWSDATTSGGMVSVLPALSTSKLAVVQNAFRDEID